MGFDEWGTFSIDELESLELPFGLTIERDIYFKETTFNEITNSELDNDFENIRKNSNDTENNLEI